jgi:hypothetical protein
MTDMPLSPALAAGDGFRVGRVLSRSFEVFSRHFLSFSLLAAIPAPLPFLLAFLRAAALTAPVPGGRPSVIIAGALVVLAGVLFWFVLTLIAHAMILYGAFQDMRGRRVLIGEAAKRGFARVLPIIGLAICEAILLVFGAILLVFPMLMFMAMFYVALPVCVIEKAGPVDSLRRSAALTKGHRWKIFGLALMLGLATLIVTAVIGGVFHFVKSAIILATARFLWQAIFGAFSGIVGAMVYHDLRAAREGIDIDKMAAVFD